MPRSTGEGPLVDLAGRRRSFRRWARRIAVGVAVLAGAAGALAGTWRVTSIRVEGAQRLSPEAVLERAGLSGGERMLLTRFGEVEGRVEELPAVREATVRRRLPSTIVIAVRERRPLVRLGGTERLVAGPEGVVFEVRSEVPLPILVGWEGEARAGARLGAPGPRVLSAVAGFPEALRERTMRIELGEDLTLVLDEGTEVRFGRATELGAKGAAAAAVLREAAGREASLAYVDVRSPRAPVARDREPSSPEPTGPTTPAP